MTTVLPRPTDATEALPQQSVPDAERPAAPVRAQARPPAPPAVHSLVLTGTLSRADTPWLEEQLDDARATGARTIEVDVSQVPAMHTAVARLLLRTAWRLGDPQRRLVLLHPRPAVLRVLRFCGAAHLVQR
jgi:anti-anti-sigma regulatory factor